MNKTKLWTGEGREKENKEEDTEEISFPPIQHVEACCHIVQKDLSFDPCHYSITEPVVLLPPYLPFISLQAWFLEQHLL